MYRSPSTNALPCFPLPCRRGSSTLYVEEAAAAAVLSARSRSARRRTCVSAWTDSPLVAARRSPRQTPRRARRGACGCPHGRLGQKSRLEYAGAIALVVAARVSKANSTAAVGPSDSAAASAVLLLGMLASRGPHDATYQHRRHRGANATDHATANVTAHATTHVTGLATGNCQRPCHWPRSRHRLRQSHRHNKSRRPRRIEPGGRAWERPKRTQRRHTMQREKPRGTRGPHSNTNRLSTVEPSSAHNARRCCRRSEGTIGCSCR